MKTYMKLFGSEVLYLLLSALVAGAATWVQMIDKRYLRETSGLFFNGSYYMYSPLFYCLGLVLFAGFMIIGYLFFLKKRIRALSQLGIIPKIVFAIIVVLFSFLMHVMILICYIFTLGLGDSMYQERLFFATLFGCPVFCLVLMIVAEILAVKIKHNES